MFTNIKIKLNKKSRIIISIVAIAVISIVYVIKNNEIKPKEVTIEKTLNKTISETATSSGNVEAKYRSNIVLDGSQKVLTIKVKEGQVVKKGDLLLELDSSDYQTKLDKELINLENAKLALNEIIETGAASEKSSSENAFSQEKYNLELAKRDYEDLKKKYDQNEVLFTNDAISQNQLDESKKNLDDAETNVKSAEDSYKNAEITLKDVKNNIENKIANQKNQIVLIQKNIDEYKKKIEDSKIISNIDGKVIKIDAKENQFPSKGDEIIVDDVSQYKVAVDIKQYDALKVQNGQKANIKIKGSDISYNGTVTDIGQLAEPKTSTGGNDEEYKVKVSVVIDEPKEEVKAGYEADVQFIFQEKENCIAVGFDGIKQDKSTGKTYVYVVNSDNTISKRYIKTGIESEYYVEITEGLQENESYVLNPPESLVDGDLVKQGTSGKTSANKK
ncbi:efflux RND transporter periplasmic adaptor subunit [Clostridium beijerinckii]|uniref:efflux RND transporter periplasmic adaptor subunit n=1 Tax=Clostridium beijerinckii TaxID=1520 RepID=UPI0013614986|nr:HlyD family efflux transporter periplasmic adaptor subunit [Clostridium beijerinckii]MZK52116.1 HlyD family efflux transporter periplasmic adaptor subunit [Clostridium beijerinckii]MZK61263.1 HlyD family efflux transporter periplasmic adaptor subunit [Clostridium beijerinckii]MZK71506.1 HlyD family efflux transporter periplasmic adaptor subunit [Clostridium beijerinckii]MZK76865.1 HlyD family efflux transporter periplasmic adaptor subunit [Clostridium beijerinckii]MZK85509.1 HlyD family eff